jgi:hypothetical protein
MHLREEGLLPLDHLAERRPSLPPGCWPADVHAQVICSNCVLVRRMTRVNDGVKHNARTSLPGHKRKHTRRANATVFHPQSLNQPALRVKKQIPDVTRCFTINKTCMNRVSTVCVRQGRTDTLRPSRRLEAKSSPLALDRVATGASITSSD